MTGADKLGGLLAMLLAASLGSNVRGDVISLRADLWCPYNCMPNDVRPGFVIEVIQNALAANGHQLDYKILNWARAIRDSREGKFTGIVGALRDDAPDFVFPEVEQGVTVDSFWVRKGDPWRWSGVASLDKVTLGVITEYAYSNPLGSYISEHKDDKNRIFFVSGEDPLRRNVEMLRKSRVGVLVESMWVMRYFLSQSPDVSDTVEFAGELPGAKVYVAFSPRHPQAEVYAKMISAGVTSLRTSGELKVILKRYGLEDWVQHH